MTHGRRPPPIVTGDRNARVLREHQHTQFVERVRAGLVPPQDRFGKPLAVGDLVLWHPTMDPCCQIVAIETLPIDQQRPHESTGVRLVLAVTVQEAVETRQPAIFFAKIGHVEAPAADTGPHQADAQPESTPETPQPLSGGPDTTPLVEPDPAESPDDPTD